MFSVMICFIICLVLFLIATLGIGEFLLLRVLHREALKISQLQEVCKIKPSIYRYMATKGVNLDLMKNMKYDQPSCFDIESAEEVTIPAGGNVLIDTGLIFDLPENRELQIRPRSGWTYKTKNLVIFGTGDSDYRGTYKINVFNLSGNDVKISVGDRIAQGFIGEKVFISSRDSLERVESIDEFVNPLTERGKKGFGSSGVSKKK